MASTNLVALDFTDTATATPTAEGFVTGQSGPLRKVASKYIHGMCGEGGTVQQRTLETEVTLVLRAKAISIEILQTDWAASVTHHVPNDTVTHRARNYAGYYKKMPGGLNLKVEVPFSAITQAQQHAETDPVVELNLSTACLKWDHRPNRMYGPWADPGGPWTKKTDADRSGGANCLRLSFASPVEAAAFLISLRNARSPKVKPASTGAENAAPQNPLRPLEGKTFVFTGDRPGSKRDQFEQRVQAFGGKVTSAVSGKTSYLMAYDRSTTKFKKACELRDANKPAPEIIYDEAKFEEVLARAAACRDQAAAPSDEPVAKRPRVE